MNHLDSTTSTPQKSRLRTGFGAGQGSGPKGAWRTYSADALSLELCLICPLHDCVGTKSPRCPIHQERTRLKAQPEVCHAS